MAQGLSQDTRPLPGTWFSQACLQPPAGSRCQASEYLYTCFAHGPLHWPASQRDLASPGQEVQERTASTQHRSHKSFHNLISEMAPHHFRRVLFNRHESVSPAHTQGEGIPFGKKYWETRRWAHGDHLSVLPVQLSTKRAVLLDGLISTATKAPGP